MSTPSMPLVLLLDDMQWADPASLKLFQSIMVRDFTSVLNHSRFFSFTQTAEIDSLMILGAYRGTEVDSSHRLAEVLDKLKKTDGVDLEIVSLKPLESSALCDLIHTCVTYGFSLVSSSFTRSRSLFFFSMRKDDAEKLADAILPKTLGNPFFAIHYLKRLYDDRVLHFDCEAGVWVCDAETVATMDLAENAAQLMIGTLQKLDPEVRERREKEGHFR
jgi:predicted ATPase